MIKLIAFDMDGTLTNSETIISTVANRLLAHYGHPPLPRPAIIRHVGFGAKNLIRGVMQEAGLTVDADEAYPIYDSIYNQADIALVDVYPNVKETLAALRAQGVWTVVLSNRPHHQTVRIVNAVLPDALDEVYGEREGIPMKPDPTALNQIMAANAVKPEECLYVGDMQFDIKVAQNAKVRSVGCLWGFGGTEQVGCADYVLNQPSDLLTVVQELNAEN